MNVSWKFSGCSQEVLRVSKGSFKVVSRKIEGWWGVFSGIQGSSKGV